MFGIFIVITAMLLTTDFLTSMLMRFLCVGSFYGRAAFFRADPLLFVITFTIFYALIEMLSYVNQKEKAQLFLKIQQSAF